MVVARLLVDDRRVIEDHHARMVVGDRDELALVAAVALERGRARDHVDVRVDVVGRPDAHHVEAKARGPRIPLLIALIVENLASVELPLAPAQR